MQTDEVFVREVVLPSFIQLGAAGRGAVLHDVLGLNPSGASAFSYEGCLSNEVLGERHEMGPRWCGKPTFRFEQLQSLGTWQRNSWSNYVDMLGIYYIEDGITASWRYAVYVLF